MNFFQLNEVLKAKTDLTNFLRDIKKSPFDESTLLILSDYLVQLPDQISQLIGNYLNLALQYNFMQTNDHETINKLESEITYYFNHVNNLPDKHYINFKNLTMRNIPSNISLLDSDNRALQLYTIFLIARYIYKKGFNQVISTPHPFKQTKSSKTTCITVFLRVTHYFNKMMETNYPPFQYYLNSTMFLESLSEFYQLCHTCVDNGPWDYMTEVTNKLIESINTYYDNEPPQYIRPLITLYYALDTRDCNRIKTAIKQIFTSVRRSANESS